MVQRRFCFSSQVVPLLPLPPAQSQHAASDLIQEQSVPYQFGVGYSGSGYTQSL